MTDPMMHGFIDGITKEAGALTGLAKGFKWSASKLDDAAAAIKSTKKLDKIKALDLTRSPATKATLPSSVPAAAAPAAQTAGAVAAKPKRTLGSKVLTGAGLVGAGGMAGYMVSRSPEARSAQTGGRYRPAEFYQ